MLELIQHSNIKHGTRSGTKFRSRNLTHQPKINHECQHPISRNPRYQISNMRKGSNLNHGSSQPPPFSLRISTHPHTHTHFLHPSFPCPSPFPTPKISYKSIHPPKPNTSEVSTHNVQPAYRDTPSDSFLESLGLVLPRAHVHPVARACRENESPAKEGGVGEKWDG
jgi:hypothetical protein